MKIKWYNNPYSLCEDNQDLGIQFSFVTKKWEQCHPWVKCRDFLHDAIHTTLTGTTSKIHGFVFGKDATGCHMVDTDVTRMLVTQSGLYTEGKQEDVDKFTWSMRHAVNLLNHYERIAGIDKLSTVVVDVSDGKRFWYFESDSWWMKSPPLISLYTLLIRLGVHKIAFSSDKGLQAKFSKLLKAKKQTNDTRFLKECAPHLTTIVRGADEYLLDSGDYDSYYKVPVEISIFHHHSGIRSLCRAADGNLEEYGNPTKANVKHLFTIK